MVLFFLLSHPEIAGAQQPTFSERDSFQPKRFWTVAGVGALIYGSTVVGLNEAWYKDNPRTGFHFFNDWNEWHNMDKMGHAFTGYFETELCFKGALWTGMPRKSATWTATGLALVFQGTIEILDAYAEKWGFSVPDMAFNIIGTGLFTGQELLWHEQKIRMKISNRPKKYSQALILSEDGTQSTTPQNRAEALFGTHYAEKYLKDYNAQTVWVSINPNAFFPKLNLPSWLNLAVGYGSENLFGGFSNTWKTDEASFQLSNADFPRYKQWFISPDIDFNRIKTDKPWLKMVFSVLNIFKIPAPALEYRTKGSGSMVLHWLYL
jgi:hypothetical protein